MFSQHFSSFILTFSSRSYVLGTVLVPRRYRGWILEICVVLKKKNADDVIIGAIAWGLIRFSSTKKRLPTDFIFTYFYTSGFALNLRVSSQFPIFDRAPDENDPIISPTPMKQITSPVSLSASSPKAFVFATHVGKIIWKNASSNPI